MVDQKPLMPKATAVWLVDNTALSFEQIADFCGLHPLEVKGIADEDVAKGIKGQDPVATGQLTREQIADAEKDPRKRLKMAPAKHKMPNVRLKRAPRYTPVSKRQDKPDAVYWLIRNHSEFTDSDIIKLIGTTKATIAKIRERSHWNAANIKAVDPVTLGLCSQLELDLAVSRASAKHEWAQKRASKTGASLKSIAETTGDPLAMPPVVPAEGEGAPAPDVFQSSGAGAITAVRRGGQIKQLEKVVARPANREFGAAMHGNMHTLVYRLIEGNAAEQMPGARLP
jgi:hypothetical protein